jgi:hypothetical protein
MVFPTDKFVAFVLPSLAVASHGQVPTPVEAFAHNDAGAEAVTLSGRCSASFSITS